MKAVVATVIFIIALVKISHGWREIQMRYELAHCEFKSKLKMEKINEIHSQIICNSIIIGHICGDKCLKTDREWTYISTCHCGGDKFNRNEPFYCCTPPDVSCYSIYNKYDVICPMGKKLPFNEKCHFQHTCPTSARSFVAVTTNCNQTRNCPVSDVSSSKICTNHVNITSIEGIENACVNGVACPKNKNGPVYQQCYNK